MTDIELTIDYYLIHTGDGVYKLNTPDIANMIDALQKVADETPKKRAKKSKS